ncbi:MAG: lactamase [Actinomycetia bacterium]|nr:lactamase [Actinomycetes bacterium]
MADMTPGVPSALSPLVRRIVGPNPGPMTGPGTNTYLVGIDEVAVIDPGVDDAAHVESIVGASMRERIRWVLLTHLHPDHFPAAERLVAATGAEVLAGSSREPGLKVDRVIGEGDIVDGTEFGLEVIATPGHAPDHLCFLLEEERLLFTGDTVLQGTTSVIHPPRGDLAVYLTTLERLRKLRLSRIAPGHGDVIEDPRGAITEYLEHRAKRERELLDALGGGPHTVKALVKVIYPEISEELREVAGWQTYATLIKLRTEGKVQGRDSRSSWSLT